MAKKSKKTGRSPKKGSATRAAMADMDKEGKLWKKTKKGKRSKRAGGGKSGRTRGAGKKWRI